MTHIRSNTWPSAVPTGSSNGVKDTLESESVHHRLSGARLSEFQSTHLGSIGAMLWRKYVWDGGHGSTLFSTLERIIDLPW